MSDINKKHEEVKTNACCTLEAPAMHIQNALKSVHDDVQAKYYGCGGASPFINTSGVACC